MRLLLLIVTLAVAALSFHLIEQPGRRIRATLGRSRGLVPAACGACVLVAVFVGLLSALDPERAGAIPIQAATTKQPSPVVLAVARTQPADAVYARTVRAWQRVIRAGLTLRRLPPSLRPRSPHLAAAFPPPCRHGLPGVVPDECVVGNPAAAQVAVLNGDSHAEMLRNAVWRAFDPKTWSIHIFARDGCGWAGALP